MSATRIPADRVLEVRAALDAAMALCDAHPGNAQLWSQLLSARATVNAYLVAKIPALEIEVVEAREAA
ncbi:MAG TPA: hypothetical protein VEA81_00275 [Burkholderiaceae bacterium]|nr:hypothetical protein [Burkholderiaceae bacterium]